MAFRVAVCLCVLVLGTILARPAKGDDRLKQEPKYDTTTVIDFGAVVVEIREVQKDNPLSGVNLVVRSDSDATFNVYVAPVDFVKSFEITFRKGDNVHIVGSKIKFGGDTVVLGREIRKDSTTLYLRGREGGPYWTPSGKPAS
jgi:hypothetical protein